MSIFAEAEKRQAVHRFKSRDQDGDGNVQEVWYCYWFMHIFARDFKATLLDAIDHKVLGSANQMVYEFL